MPVNREQRRAAAKKGDMPVVSLNVNGETYTLDMNDLTSQLDRELYLGSKLTIGAIAKAMQDEIVSPFMVAAIVFLARRVAGEEVSYREVEDSIGFDVEIGEVEKVDDLPEAPAAD